MNNLAIQSEVKRMLGNMRSSDPFINDVQVWVNRGLTDVTLEGVRGLAKGIDLFPELRCSWDSDLTVNAINNQALPSDKLTLTSVSSYDKASPNHNYDRATPIKYFRPERFDTITKDSTRVGWPRIWTMRGHSSYYYPTPSASPTDYRTILLYHGIQKEPAMSADGDTPLIADVWHYAVVLRAAAIGALAKGWTDKAAAWNAEMKAELGFSTNIGAEEDAAQWFHVELPDLLDRSGVYGG